MSLLRQKDKCIQVRHLWSVISMLIYFLSINDFIVDFDNQLHLYLRKSIKSFSTFHRGTSSGQNIYFFSLSLFQKTQYYLITLSFDKSSGLPEGALGCNFSVLSKHFRSKSNLLKYLNVVYWVSECIFLATFPSVTSSLISVAQIPHLGCHHL